ncbi:MAG: hypothetical protein KJZ81_15425 [Burkholderiaceae bacterium]|nr:hypothetical protein [Burkholderiaceae bacterium]
MRDQVLGSSRIASPIPAPLLIVGAFALAALSALMIGGGLFRAAAVVAVLPMLVVVLSLLLLRRFDATVDFLVIGLFALIIASYWVQSLTSVRIDFLIDLVLFGLSPSLFIRLFRFSRTSKYIFALIMGMISISLLGILTSLLGRSTLLAASFQFVTNLKIFILLALGVSAAWAPKTENIFWKGVKYFSIILLVHIIWQLAHPSSFLTVYPYARATEDKFGLFAHRLVGIFPHYSAMGIVCAILGLISVVRARYTDRRFWWVALIFAVGLFGSVQRAEIVLFFVLTAFFFAMATGGRGVALKASVAILIVASLLVFAIVGLSEHLEREARSWGFLESPSLYQPRQVMFWDSIELANSEFPGGTGLGTFGSAGAQKFDWSLYTRLGYGAYNWFGSGRTVLMDNYWPNLLAELGWFGLLVMLMIVGSLGIRASWGWLTARSGSEQRTRWAYAWVGVLFLIGNSVTTNSFQDPAVMLIPFLFFGVALRRERDS